MQRTDPDISAEEMQCVSYTAYGHCISSVFVLAFDLVQFSHEAMHGSLAQVTVQTAVA